MRLPTHAVCKKDYKVNWCIYASEGQRVRIHDYNNYAVQISFGINLIWVSMKDFDEFFDPKW